MQFTGIKNMAANLKGAIATGLDIGQQSIDYHQKSHFGTEKRHERNTRNFRIHDFRSVSTKRVFGFN